MSTAFQSTISIIFIVLPIFTTVFLYQLMKFVTKHQWRSIHFSVQWSAMFYAIAVSVMVGHWLGHIILGYIFIAILLLLSIIIIRQWKKHNEVIMQDALKIAMRIVFLIFGLSYMICLIIEFVQFIMVKYGV